MASKRDYYEVLGAAKGAGDAEIKKSYRQMAKKYHPDANPGDKAAEERFKEINEAYSVLSDPQKRAAYDQMGHAAFEQAAPGGGGFGGMDFDMGDIFGGMFSDFFGGGASRRNPNAPRRGADIQVQIQIDFEQSVFGAEREISLAVTDACGECGGGGAKRGSSVETCKRCGGSGQERVTQQTIFGMSQVVRACSGCGGRGKIVKEPCPRCGGQGIVRKQERLAVKIPKGIDNGQMIRLAGKGEAGANGGPKGDILVAVYIKPHRTFSRKGGNLYMDMDISFVQAALGDEITVPTIYGDERHAIRPGTQPGAVVTLRGKGVPHVNNERVVGDLYVKLNLKVPTNLTERQKELLREFGDVKRDEKPKKKKLF
jgi:molecular chaperone DnaJ